jgi:hypothetical protein
MEGRTAADSIWGDSISIYICKPNIQRWLNQEILLISMEKNSPSSSSQPP